MSRVGRGYDHLYIGSQKFCPFRRHVTKGNDGWVPLLACPAVLSLLALLDKPAVAPTSKSVITFDNSYIPTDSVSPKGAELIPATALNF
jgi:hypothetical protein